MNEPVLRRVSTSRFMARAVTALLCIAVTACGGGTAPPGGGGGGGVTPPATGSCSLRSRQDWAAAQISEWYLFPDLIASGVNPSDHATVQSYIDALVAPARAQNRDRGFTYITSIAEENAFNTSGQTAAFGIRIQYDTAARRAFVTDAFEGAPALGAGIDRGAEILAIGTSEATLESVSSLMAGGGSAAVSAAFGASTAGLARTLRISDASGTRVLNIIKADFNIQPVSPRFGVRVISDASGPVGYINLRTFISTADAQLRSAFLTLRNQGVTRFIIDFRHNGGGLVSTAELMGDLMGGNRFSSEVFSRTVFRPEKSSNNDVHNFTFQSQSVSPVRIAFIGTGATASASEFVINGFIPYYPTSMALVGANTFGKPVGQIARDRAECDDRLRITAFATQNSLRQGEYFNGMADKVPNSCAATDDVGQPLGDARENSVARSLDFLNGRVCSPIAANTARSLSADASERAMLIAANPTAAQREVPGLF
ncbi:S41 family peptidase [Sandarakinorhabdus sp.]|uniref:S41 family peptidase n=1 Tax=Sandarakinorhabdus sp. TaxID=1916663 RepID=UPI00286E0FF1|nr:S41 family peptidase [Sandarakinorhabdus sp.]